MTSEDEARSQRYRRVLGAGVVGIVLASSLLSVVLLTREDDKLESISPTSLRPPAEALSTSTTLNTRLEVIERLRKILRIRDEAFRERNAEILKDVYTIDCPCLEGDRNAIHELADNKYRMVGGATSIKVQKASRVNENSG